MRNSAISVLNVGMVIRLAINTKIRHFKQCECIFAFFVAANVDLRDWVDYAGIEKRNSIQAT